MSAAIDAQYEDLRLDYRPARIWDTTLYAYRWVLLAPWRIGAPPQPADPDAALDAAAPLFKPNNRGASVALAGQLELALSIHGPMTAVQVGEMLHFSDDRVRNYMARHDTFIALRFSGVNYWGLAGQHEDWQPPLRNTEQLILDLLTENGEMTTPQLEHSGVSLRALYVLHKRGQVTRRMQPRGGGGPVVHIWRIPGAQNGG